MKKLLLTAFYPFGGDELNAALEVQNALPDRIGSLNIFKVCLPVVFGKASDAAAEAAENLHPDAIVCLGQAGKRDSLTPERIAVNLMDSVLPDSSGYAPEDVPVSPDGPAAYFSTLPVKAMTEAMRRSGAPARLSNTAGTYVCNSVMYSMLHWTAARCPSVPCGFIHIPYLDVQTPGAGIPVLPKETAVNGITAALQVLDDLFSE